MLLTNVFLSIIAGFIALSMFHLARERRYLKAWKALIVALVLFAVEEVFGALKIFGVWSTPWLTHVIPSFILVLFIWALISQIYIAKGCVE